MKLIELIIKTIREEYQSGETQVQIAKRHNVPQAYIQRLLNGKSNGLTLETLERMFPNLAIDLSSNDNSLVNSGSHASGSINHHCNIVQGDRPSAREFLDVLMLSDEFDDALKSKLYRYYSDLCKKEQYK